MIVLRPEIIELRINLSIELVKFAFVPASATKIYVVDDCKHRIESDEDA